MNKGLLSINEFCEFANIGRTYTYQLINEGKIKAVKLGNKTLISKIEMDNWLESLPAYTSRVTQKDSGGANA